MNIEGIIHKYRKYGRRLKRAIETVKDKRTIKVLFNGKDKDIWVVYGRRKHRYLVVPGKYCSCTDFLINVVTKRTTDKCYHLIAQEIASLSGEFQVIRIDNLKAFFKEIFENM